MNEQPNLPLQSNMLRCLDVEPLLADYIDETLTSSERAAVEQHLATCPGCKEFAAELAQVTQFVAKAPPVEPPADLVTRIIFETQSGRHGTFSRGNWLQRALRPLVQPFLQPRLAMGMALTILSFSMVARLAGIQVTEIKASDLEPSRVWMEIENRTLRGWDAVVKKYENFKLVIEIQQRLNEMTSEPEAGKPTDPNDEKKESR
jgi:hypothetical protein